MKEKIFEDKNGRVLGIIIGFVAIFLAVSSNSLVKEISNSVSPLAQSFILSFLSLFVNLVLFWKKIFKNLLLSGSSIYIFFVVGFLTFFTSLFRILALSNGKLLNISIIQSLMPVAVYLLSILFLGKKFRKNLVFFLLASCYGVILVGTQKYLPSLVGFGVGEMFALLSVSFTAVNFIIRKKVSNEFNPYQITFLMMSISIIPAFLSVAFFDDISQIGRIDFAVWVLIFIRAILGVLITLGLNWGIKLIGPVLMSQISLSRNLFAVLFGVIFFSELPILPEYIGGLIVVFSIYFSNKLQSTDKNLSKNN